MSNFVEQAVIGLASGGIYALLALAIALIHRASGVINFAQGQMATLSAFVCWSLMNHGWAFWPAFGATIVVSLAGGMALEAAVIRPAQRGPLAGVVLLTVGLLIAFSGVTTWIWGGGPRRFEGPFSTAPVHIGGVAVSKQELGTIVVTLVALGLMGVVLTRTRLGLGLRAVATNPQGARLAGIRVTWMAALGWGLATVLGAVAGVIAAPSLGLEPDMMRTVFVYALAAAVLGGMDSPLGAVVSGLGLGVLVNLVGSYVDWVDGGLRLATAFAVLLAVLVVRPSGLFGSRTLGRA